MVYGLGSFIGHYCGLPRRRGESFNDRSRSLHWPRRFVCYPAAKQVLNHTARRVSGFDPIAQGLVKR